jgi:uncharacterized membrane protein YbhN (UPF0104 family)
MGRVSLFALLQATACLGVLFLLRAYRWQRFVEPLQPLPLRPFFSATLIGFMANDLLPLRAGELVRAYALAHLTHVRMSAALATAVLERVWDTILISVLLIGALSSFPLPAWLVQTSLLILGGCVVSLIGGWWLARRGEDGLSWLPPRLATLVGHFGDGLGALHSVSLIVWASLLSLMIWLALVAYYWVLLRACGFALPVEAALMVMVLTVLGAALPAAPGFVGTFQYATVWALSFFSVSKADALGFSIIAHLAQILPVTIAGLIALVQARLPLWPTRLVPAQAEAPHAHPSHGGAEADGSQSASPTQDSSSSSALASCKSAVSNPSVNQS